MALQRPCTNSVTVINTKAATVSATIPLAGNPEFAAVDGTARRIYCNIEDRNEVAVIEAGKHEVVAHWPLAPDEGRGEEQRRLRKKKCQTDSRWSKF